jgi:hypothetical protein
MPDVKACLWNIQNFGQDSPKYNGTNVKNKSNSMRNEFISRFVHANAIDVLLIQEVSSTPLNALTDLCSKLNALNLLADRDWCYSYCGSAIANKRVDVPGRPIDLAYRTGARTEGYAVLWRSNQIDRFRMISSLYPIATASGPGNDVQSPLNISLRGRPTGVQNNLFGPTGGYMYLNKYPFNWNAVAGQFLIMDEWPKLNYPPTSKVDRRGVQWERARRPVYVVLKMSGGENLLCPVCVYHAPSNQTAASWGAYVAGLARELYAVNAVTDANAPNPDELVPVRKGVFGGDFNLSVNLANWVGGDYMYFINRYERADTGGASRRAAPLQTLPDADRRTTVQILKDNHRTPIDDPGNNAYLKWKIDLAFSTAATQVTAARVDLLAVLRADVAGVYAVPLQQTAAYMNLVEAAIQNAPQSKPEKMVNPTGVYREVTKKVKKKTVKKWVPVISGAWGGTFMDWEESKKQFTAGLVTDARRAAEYMHIFVSDHLPLVAAIPV